MPNSGQPLQMTDLPSDPWKNVSVDLTGPFPSGDYMLVAIDDYSRYPEVEILQSTSARAVIPKLDAIFARQGIPTVVKSYNGPPFNSKDFADFSEYLGFDHRRITPLWPEANGEAERFLRSLKKCVQTATAERLNWKQELWKLLRQYRATPHCTTDLSPYEAITKRQMNIQLPEVQTQFTTKRRLEKLRHTDETNKMKMKDYADNRRHTKPSSLTDGDTVLVRQPQHNTLTSRYDPRPYTVTKTKGSMLTAKRGQHQITRNSSHFKPVIVNAEQLQSDEEEIEIDPPLLRPRLNDSSSTAKMGSNPYQPPSVDVASPRRSCFRPTGELRRSAREKKPPVRFNDFQLNQLTDPDM